MYNRASLEIAYLEKTTFCRVFDAFSDELGYDPSRIWMAFRFGPPGTTDVIKNEATLALCHTLRERAE